ncbi:hypothetical protein EJ05DRAFT_385789 [Pseudovirgaria hyperparasitica]|uniref:Uncharacterized protein n=1 Tax=Pseudovirgaria hyperparasitica TaxID=470096 RepID=A0A6A6W5T0_9PEZI|nr:uncharacterized protein EJ05DRAFT_385789 [Pseudovirgaria hyperparasitica]KAF2757306.1 hypothetical protein EJ05DRAFT_385789 [Pseudovirgaria hyperparasitica]
MKNASSSATAIDTSTSGRAGKRTKSVSALHPQVAVILGVPKVWHVFLQGARLMAMSYSITCCYWSLQIFFDLVFVYSTTPPRLELRETENGWTLERRLEVACVLLAALWCSASAYLSFFFTDCLMSRWLLNYTPFATLLRLGMTDFLLGYVPKLALARLGAFKVPSRLVPSWILITLTVAIAYHLTHDLTSIKRETEATRKVLLFAMTVTLFGLILPHHVPLSSEL